ncbi:MAG: hypothetical protein IT292_06835 [Deltaproteobacteria bacterium]|nr:hypothetical protein [Deltaproteobacteria bacterium]
MSVDLVSGLSCYHAKGQFAPSNQSQHCHSRNFYTGETEDKILVDGGVLNPVPTTLAKELGADYVIAVDLFADRDFGTSTENLMTEQSETGGSSLLNSLSSMPEILAKLAKNTSSKLQKDIPINILGVIENTLAISQQALTERAMNIYPPALIVQPKVGKIGLLDFHKAEQGITIGYQAMKELLPNLEKQIR